MTVGFARAALLLFVELLVVIALGCSSARRGQPDPAACVTAADCASGPLVDPDNVCCDSGVHLDVFSRKYLAWRAQVRAAECKAASCPPMPPPAPPRACAIEPRCVANRCTDSCDP